MKCIRLLLLALPVLAAGAHAADSISGGTITFRGAVTRDTSSSARNGTYDPKNLVASTTVLPLDQAQAMLSSEVLNYFASYAKPATPLINITYK
jgi:hypothetical protein